MALMVGAALVSSCAHHQPRGIVASVVPSLEVPRPWEIKSHATVVVGSQTPIQSYDGDIVRAIQERWYKLLDAAAVRQVGEQFRLADEAGLAR